MRNTKMISNLPFDSDRLKFIKYSAQEQPLPNLNFAQSNGEDPLHVQDYYQRIRTEKPHDNEAIFVLKYESEWIGFFSIVFANIRRERNHKTFILGKFDTPNSIKGLLINKIGIIQEYRCYGIGRYILQFCIGLSKSLELDNQKVRIIIFETTKSVAEKIYHRKYRFNVIEKENRVVWAYKIIH